MMRKKKFLLKEIENTDSVAQLVEQYTFNVWVLGSSPSGITKKQSKWAAFLVYGYINHMAEMYILFSKKLNKYYVGACNNLARRVYEHNLGHSKFTSTGTPWELVYNENYDDLNLAKRRELQIKKMKSRKYIESLISR